MDAMIGLTLACSTGGIDSTDWTGMASSGLGKAGAGERFGRGPKEAKYGLASREDAFARKIERIKSWKKLNKMELENEKFTNVI